MFFQVGEFGTNIEVFEQFDVLIGANSIYLSASNISKGYFPIL